MGQIVRRKRRGRPSNSDRARSKSFAAPPSPVCRRRSRRRRTVRFHFNIDDYVDDDEYYDDEDAELGRREKKLRLLLCQDDSRSNRRVTHAPTSSSSFSEEDDEDDDIKPSKKRKIIVDDDDDDDDEDDEIEEMLGRKLEEEEDEEEEEESAAGGSDLDCGTTSDLPKGVPLPDTQTLELILDKLQKKDIYGVYAEPVDPDELPDYHDVIKHPMDFATVRKKLAKGSYLTLKEFESDVLLICTNAMQYNAPDTIYYKQASSIQELAKLKFQMLRDTVDQPEIESKSEPKTTPSFCFPKKQPKKSVAWTSQDPVGSISFSGGDARTGDFPNTSSAQIPDRPNNSEVPTTENSPLADNNLDKEQEIPPGKGFISKLGRKPSVLDENRRASYNTFVQPVTESNSVFSTFDGESKQFIPVGLHVDHSYARSLSRFAATLGSVAWKIASRTIEQALPEGVKFGRGWVGEYEPLSPPVLMPRSHPLKEPDFPSHSQTNPNSRFPEKASNVTAPGNSLTDSWHDSQKPPGYGNTPVDSLRKRDIPKDTSKDHRPPFFSSFKHPNGNGEGYREPIAVSRDCNRTVPTEPGLSDPVQILKTISEKAQQNHSNGFGFGAVVPKREDSNSNNADSTIPQFSTKPRQHQQIGSSKRENPTTAVQAWMSLGGTGGFVKPPLSENTNPHKQQISADSLYNSTRDRHQPQTLQFQYQHLVPQPVSRFQVQHSWKGVAGQMQQPRPKQQESRPPDLNIGYQSMGSPVRQSTGMNMMVDSQQPDLALQL